MKEQKKRRLSNFLYDFVKITGAIPTLIWFRLKVYHFGEKQKLKGGFLISANHVSFLDPLIIYNCFWKRRVHALATTDLYKGGFSTFFFSHMNCIPVDKNNFSISSFREVCDRLSSDVPVLIFPEGHVNQENSDTIEKYKQGAILMAHKSKKPILPVYIVKPKKWYERKKIVIGNLFYPHEMLGAMPSMDEISKVNELLYQKEFELENYYKTCIIKEKTNG